MNNFYQSYCLFILNFVIQVFIRSSNAFHHTSFIILSQPNDFHSKLSQKTGQRLRETLNDNGFQSTQILIASEDISYHGSWTIFPILSELVNKLKLTPRCPKFVPRGLGSTPRRKKINSQRPKIESQTKSIPRARYRDPKVKI